MRSYSRYHGTGFRITFVNFLLLALPVAVIMLVLCWLWLQIFFNRKEFVLLDVNELSFIGHGCLRA